jgi:DinB superfamily
MNKTLRWLDSIHSKLVDTIMPIDDPLFSQSPAETEWSIAEIVHHLYLVEEKVIEEIEKELAKPPRRIGFLRKLIPISIVAYRVRRVRAPRLLTPINPPSRAELIANYNAARSRLKDLCSTHGRSRLQQSVFKHPFLGEIDGTALVSSVGYHEIRHYKQIRDVIRKLDRNSKTV